MRSAIVASVAASALLALAGTAVAGKTIKVPKDQPTIQAAVNAASSGDKINLNPGTYYENVVVATAGIRIEGPKEAILDGNIDGVDGDCITINAADVVVKGITFRHGRNQVVLSADDAEILSCTMKDAAEDGVTGTASGTTITSLKFLFTGSACVDLIGHDNVVSKCTMTRVGSFGVRLVGADNEVISCTFAKVADNNAVFITGDNAVISKNKCTDGDLDCYRVDGLKALVDSNTGERTNGRLIVVNGNDAAVKKNTGKFCRGGIRVVGDGAELLQNTLNNTVDDAAISVTGDKFDIKGNKINGTWNEADGISASSATPGGGGKLEGNNVNDAGDWGFDLDTINGVTIVKNTATRCGTGGAGGFRVVGNDNSLDKSNATDSEGVGISIEGNDNSAKACNVKNSSTDGFHVNAGSTGNSFNDCDATNCGGEGFDNRGINTDLTKCTFSKNRIDIANDHVNGATFAGGLDGAKFTTGGETTLPEVD
jgi:hypothetical protein